MKIEGAQLPREMSAIEKLSFNTDGFDPDMIDKHKLMGTEAIKAGFIGKNLPLQDPPYTLNYSKKRVQRRQLINFNAQKNRNL